MVLINTVDYESIRCYPQNCQKIPLPTSYFSPLIGIQFTTLDQNNLIIMYGLPNVHKQNSPLGDFPQHSFRVRSFWSRSLRSGTLRSWSFGSEAKFGHFSRGHYGPGHFGRGHFYLYFRH